MWRPNATRRTRTDRRAEYRHTSVSSFDHEFSAATPIDKISTSIDPSSHRLAFSVGYRY